MYVRALDMDMIRYVVCLGSVMYCMLSDLEMTHDSRLLAKVTSFAVSPVVCRHTLYPCSGLHLRDLCDPLFMSLFAGRNTPKRTPCPLQVCFASDRHPGMT